MVEGETTILPHFTEEGQLFVVFLHEVAVAADQRPEVREHFVFAGLAGDGVAHGHRVDYFEVVFEVVEVGEEELRFGEEAGDLGGEGL